MNNNQSVVLVNPKDQKIGTTDLLKAHQGEGQLHRAISVFIFRNLQDQTRPDQILVQQRAKEKLLAAGQWANTVCGHVKPGESYGECALRRLKEEIGLDGVKIEPVLKLLYQVEVNQDFSEHELDQIFIGSLSNQKLDLKLDPQEVRQTKWIDWSSFFSSHGSNQIEGLQLTPWFQYFLSNKRLIRQINSKIEAEITL